MTDITTALETVRAALGDYDSHPDIQPGSCESCEALTALSTIEAELASLRAERDEAVAALREFCDDLVKWAGTAEAQDHPEFEQGYRAAVADVKAAAAYRLARLTPKEATP